MSAADPSAGRAGASRRSLLVLGLLLLTLALVVVYQVGQSAGPLAPASNQRTTPAVAAGAEAGKSPVMNVQLAALDAERPHPPAAGRNPFRFQPVAPPRAPQTGGPSPRTAPEPLAQPAPAGPPPIPLKFIGIVEGREIAGKLAVLSDGRFVFHGREGDIIEGRYRIVRIGVESIVLEHVDGRGRQTIRLTG